MEKSSKNSTAALINLSTLSQYFIPLGNFIFPIIIWTTNKDKSDYIDRQGKNTINFQLSLFLYSLILAAIALPILFVSLLRNLDFNAFINGDNFVFDHFSFENMTGMITTAIIAIVIIGFLKIAEFFLIIYASIKTSNGDEFKYPLTIPFIK
jgi:uncharacterized protein